MTFPDVFGSFTTSLLTLLLFEDLEIFKLPTLLQLSFADDCAGDYSLTANGSGRGLRRCGDEKKHSMAAWDGFFQAKTSLQRIFLASALLVRSLCPVKDQSLGSKQRQYQCLLIFWNLLVFPFVPFQRSPGSKASRSCPG